MIRSATFENLSIDLNLENNSTGSKSKLPSKLKSNYSRLRQKFVKATPEFYKCKFFCGGISCKFCDPGNFFSPKFQAISGLYSHWITPGILASSRPTTNSINKFQLVAEFLNNEIKSIFNLQTPNEHPFCGPGLTESGFSYDPEVFMRSQIYYYNFVWPDFGSKPVDSLLDMVKVMSFARNNGKILVHCHAGLGRTGTLICCFLVWKKKMQPATAIYFTRMKRPGSVQTSEQVSIIYKFAELLKPVAKSLSGNFSFEIYSCNKSKILHGVEGRMFKHVPKIVYVIGQKLLELIAGNSANSNTTRENLLDFEAGNFEQKIKPGITLKRSESWLEMHNRSNAESFGKSFPPQIEQKEFNQTKSKNGSNAESLVKNEQNEFNPGGQTSSYKSNAESLVNHLPKIEQNQLNQIKSKNGSNAESNADENGSNAKSLAKSFPPINAEKELNPNDQTLDLKKFQEQLGTLYQLWPKYKKILDEHKVLMRLDENELCEILLNESDPFVLFLTMDEFFQLFEKPIIIVQKSSTTLDVNELKSSKMAKYQKETLLYLSHVIACLVAVLPTCRENFVDFIVKCLVGEDLEEARQLVNSCIDFSLNERWN